MRLALLASVALCVACEAGEVRGLEEMAHDIAVREHTPKAWKKYVADARSRYEDWQADRQVGNLGMYLNDKLLEIGPSVQDGNIKALKKFVFWLALYVELSETPPKYIREVDVKHREDAEALLKDFSWEKFSNLVKDKAKDYKGTTEE